MEIPRKITETRFLRILTESFRVVLCWIEIQGTETVIRNFLEERRFQIWIYTVEIRTDILESVKL